MDYIYHLAILVGIYLILAQSFNLTFGLGRFLNLAHIYDRNEQEDHH